MKPRLLIVEGTRDLRSWLRHHLEILWPDGIVTDLEPRQFSPSAERFNPQQFDLILFGVQCPPAGSEEAASELTSLRELMRRAELPPVIVVAQGGNELTAVRAMRLGIADYLPRSLLNAQLLASSLNEGLRQRRRPPPAAQLLKLPRRRIDPAHLQLPHYALLHKLGESARAAVYLAHSATLGRNVALKISKPVGGAGENDCQEFAREYAAISALRHRSIVEIYDYGFHDGREFIAMEYFPCGDLKTRLQQPMSFAEALQYAYRIAEALQIVHGAGLVHRDLKPPNVMLREDGSIVLIDFGIAKDIGSVTHSTALGVLRGSPYYMSPEQAQGVRLDARSDLYSLGVIFFEMLSGNKPYVGQTAIEVMQQHVHGPRPPLPADCSAFEPLLQRLMARSLGERFASAAVTCEQLEVAMKQLVVSTPPAAAMASR